MTEMGQEQEKLIVSVACRTAAKVESVDHAPMGDAVDAAYCREKAALCLRLAQGLRWNNPGRDSLLELAEDFNRRAGLLEADASAEAAVLLLRSSAG